MLHLRVSPVTNPPPGEGRDKTGIGRHLRALREERGLGVTEVAELMGVTHGRVSHIESGVHNTTMATVRRYCDAIGARIHIGLVETAHTSDTSKE